jgi:hypothetical protein
MRLLRRIDGRLPIWPFDPLPDGGSVVVEIYTSIAALAAGLRKNRTKVRRRRLAGRGAGGARQRAARAAPGL